MVHYGIKYLFKLGSRFKIVFPVLKMKHEKFSLDDFHIKMSKVVQMMILCKLISGIKQVFNIILEGQWPRPRKSVDYKG